jgi:hypothetical protein
MKIEMKNPNKCSGCKAWKLDNTCELGYEQWEDPVKGIAPVGPCPKPKYVFEMKQLRKEMINEKQEVS